MNKLFTVLVFCLVALQSAIAIEPKCRNVGDAGKIVSEALPDSTQVKVAVPASTQQLTASDIQLLFKQDGTLVQYALLSEQEMKETRGCPSRQKNIHR